MITHHSSFTKNLFFVTLITSIYFVLAFTGILAKLQAITLIGAVAELITIPLIILLVIIFLFSLYQLFTKRNRISGYSIVTLSLSFSIIALMFIIN
ncbi:hypothetical protein [Pedobacter agri]|uniref:Uncharacterized protein n=1 Tax=Pedobacter agri TaxID=454586 RepID=A0A9X3IA08_9SPHI|nr:hypothetical protein [Pedobacter agri]MCX3265855.1 hypothetical protein [Pedobacter agri]